MEKMLVPYVPYRYIFEDPNTHYIYRADSKKDLFNHIINYRIQNQLPPIEALEYVIENYWCGLRENAGKCAPLKLTRGWSQYIQGGISLLKYIFYGEKNMVSQTIAEQRAGICITCPYNVFPDKGPFLKWSDEIAENLTAGKRTSLHDQLGNCSVCSCVLRAKVFFKGPFDLSPAQQNQMAAVGCWQVVRKELPTQS